MWENNFGFGGRLWNGILFMSVNDGDCDFLAVGGKGGFSK
jgi:hypothetical protein